MSAGLGAVLTFAVGVAISPVPIVAVILMLFSRRATVNGPLFLVGWVLALATVGGVAYALADAGGAASDRSGSDAVSWAKLVLGVLLLVVAVRNWRKRPAPGEDPEMPRWMAGVDGLTPVKAFGLGVLLAGVNPKNLALTLGAAGSLAQLGLPTGDAAVALAVFVVVASLTIAVPVVYDLVGGEHAARTLDRLEDWLRVHNAAVMAVLFLVFGVDLIAQALPAL